MKHHPSLNSSRITGAPQRGNKRTAQGRAKRHPGYETHTKTRPTGAKAFCTRQRKTISHGYIRFCPCRANPLSFLFPGRCPGLCAFASPRRLSIRHILPRGDASLCPGLCARWAFNPPFRCHSKCRMNLFSLIINNKNFILQPPAEGGLDKGFFMLYICSLNRSFFLSLNLNP